MNLTQKIELPPALASAPGARTVQIALAGLAMGCALVMAALPREAAAQIRCWTNASGSRECSDLPPPSDAKAINDVRGRASRIDGQDSFSQKQATERFPVIFWSNDCGEPCNNARKLLTTRGVPFSDRNPAQQDLQEEFRRLTKGQMQVPLLLVGTTQLTGFEEGQWNSTLDAAGYSRSPTGGRRPAPAAAPARTLPAPVGGPGQPGPGGFPSGNTIQNGPGGTVIPPQNTANPGAGQSPGQAPGQAPGQMPAQVPGFTPFPGAPGSPGGSLGSPNAPTQGFTPAGPGAGSLPVR